MPLRIFLAVYTVCLLALLPQLSLLLDEILDILTVRSDAWGSLLQAIPRNAGGVPLSYFARWISMDLFGDSAFAARLPSALFSVAACPAVYWLGRRFGLRRPLLAVAIFVLLPLQFRYAMEARAYSQALCLSAWASVLFLRWMDRPASRGRAALYGVCICVGLYTQPYSLFVPLSHLAWMLMARRRRGPLLAAIAVVLAAVLAFVPWYVYGAHIWSQTVASVYPQSSIGLRSTLMILREISGAGYIGTAILTVGVALGLRATAERRFWMLYLAIPVIGVIAADILFVYFLAIRQMIFVLVPVAVLFAGGVEWLLARHKIAAGALLLALAAAMVYKDVDLFRRPRENWKEAAAVLKAHPGCVLAAPPSSLDLYAYFEPALRGKLCPSPAPGGSSVAVAISPYEPEAAASFLRERGAGRWRKTADLHPQGPYVTIYQTPAH